MSKAHHLRSVTQALINQNERLELDSEHAGIQVRPFDRSPYLTSGVTLLVYRFQEDGLDLAYSGTRQVRGRRRLVPSGSPEYVGTWPFTASTPPPFDQGGAAAWEGLGELGHDVEGELG